MSSLHGKGLKSVTTVSKTDHMSAKAGRESITFALEGEVRPTVRSFLQTHMGDPNTSAVHEGHEKQERGMRSQSKTYGKTHQEGKSV